MRVLFLATYFPKPTNPTMGVWALKEAQQLQRAGADVRVVSFTSWVPRIAARSRRTAAWANCPPNHNWDGLSVEYPRWPFYQVGLLKKLWRRRPGLPLSIGWRFSRRFLAKITRDWKPDVVFAHHGGVNGELAVRLHDQFGIPIVVKDYDYYEIEDCRQFSGRMAVYQKIADRAAVMLSASRRMRDTTVELFPNARVAVHHNGAEPIPETLVRQPRPAHLANKTVISSGGIFYDRKAIPLLVRAFLPVARKFPQVVMRIFGDGQDRPVVESIIREHQLQSRIELLGFLEHEQVRQELVWADLFALVGWDEPFATVYLEAMSAGKPIICASDGGINDVFQSGVHGLSVPPRDEMAATAALERIITDTPFRIQCGKEARRLFDTQLSADVVAKRLLAILQAAVDHDPIVAGD